MGVRFFVGGVGAGVGDGADAGVKTGAEAGPTGGRLAEAGLAGAFASIRAPHFGQKTESEAITLWHFGQRFSVTMGTPQRGQKEDPSGTWDLHFGQTILHSSFHLGQGERRFFV